MKLYYAPGACSLASHIVAAEGDIAVDLEKVDLKNHRTETGVDFKSINPKGYVPALRIEDGSVLTENVAVLMYLGDKAKLTHQGTELYRLLEWLAFITSEIHKTFSPLFGQASDDVAEAAKAKVQKRLEFVEERFADDYLMGSSFCPADAYLYVMLRWCNMLGVNIAPFSKLGAFKTRMESRAGVTAALRQEGL